MPRQPLSYLLHEVEHSVDLRNKSDCQWQSQFKRAVRSIDFVVQCRVVNVLDSNAFPYVWRCTSTTLTIDLAGEAFWSCILSIACLRTNLVIGSDRIGFNLKLWHFVNLSFMIYIEHSVDKGSVPMTVVNQSARAGSIAKEYNVNNSNPARRRSFKKTSIKVVFHCHVRKPLWEGLQILSANPTKSAGVCYITYPLH